MLSPPGRGSRRADPIGFLGLVGFLREASSKGSPDRPWRFVISIRVLGRHYGSEGPTGSGGRRDSWAADEMCCRGAHMRLARCLQVLPMLGLGGEALLLCTRPSLPSFGPPPPPSPTLVATRPRKGGKGFPADRRSRLEIRYDTNATDSMAALQSTTCTGAS